MVQRSGGSTDAGIAPLSSRRWRWLCRRREGEIKTEPAHFSDALQAALAERQRAADAGMADESSVKELVDGVAVAAPPQAGSSATTAPSGRGGAAPGVDSSGAAQMRGAMRIMMQHVMIRRQQGLTPRRARRGARRRARSRARARDRDMSAARPQLR